MDSPGKILDRKHLGQLTSFHFDLHVLQGCFCQHWINWMIWKRIIFQEHVGICCLVHFSTAGWFKKEDSHRRPKFIAFIERPSSSNFCKRAASRSMACLLLRYFHIFHTSEAVQTQAHSCRGILTMFWHTWNIVPSSASSAPSAPQHTFWETNITMEHHHLSWENSLFLWPFSIANC